MSSVTTLNEGVLAAYLEANVPGFKGPLSASKFPGGQSNPTFRIDADSGTYVLRRQPPGKLLKSAHAVDREYRVLAALRDTDVPAAEVYHLCEYPAVIGSMFYLMYAKDNSRVIAVLDWELSTLGHPCADLAYQCMAMRLPASERQQMAPIGLAGLDLQPLGLPDEEEYIASYCQYMGIDHVDNWNFFLAFSFFRLAAIAQGVAKRATQGNASNASARGVGGLVDPLASMALEIIA